MKIRNRSGGITWPYRTHKLTKNCYDAKYQWFICLLLLKQLAKLYPFLIYNSIQIGFIQNSVPIRRINFFCKQMLLLSSFHHFNFAGIRNQKKKSIFRTSFVQKPIWIWGSSRLVLSMLANHFSKKNHLFLRNYANKGNWLGSLNTSLEYEIDFTLL